MQLTFGLPVSAASPELFERKMTREIPVYCAPQQNLHTNRQVLPTTHEDSGCEDGMDCEAFGQADPYEIPQSVADDYAKHLKRMRSRLWAAVLLLQVKHTIACGNFR